MRQLFTSTLRILLGFLPKIVREARCRLSCRGAHAIVLREVTAMSTPDKTPRPNYYLEFLKSPAHAWIALGTLGLGFAVPVASGTGLMAGAAAYALAWIYVPD